MLHVIESLNASDHTEILEKMFRLRTRVFRDRLGWDVKVTDGCERDRFDDQEPVYVILTDQKDEEVLGSLRLLPTTGPTLLSEVFADTVPDAAGLSSPFIWECTRFCIDSELVGQGRVEMVRTAGELLAGLGEVGLRSGIETILGNFDPIMQRVYRRIGCQVDILGTTFRFGRPVHLGSFPVTHEHLAAIRERLAHMSPAIDESLPMVA